MIRKRKRKRGKIKMVCAGWIRDLGFCSDKITNGFLRGKTLGTSMARSPN